MQQYHDLLRHVLENGTRHEDRTGVGTISAFGYQTRFDLREGFPIVTTKRVPFRWVAEELFWFLSGSTNEADLQARGVDIWAEWATAEQTARFGKEEGDLGPVYGYLWRSFGGDYPQMNGMDQIARLIREIETNPNSRRLIVTGWNPETVMKLADAVPHAFSIQDRWGKTLHVSFTNGRLMRFWACPNISSYALLTHLVAHVCGLEVGDLLHLRRSAYLFESFGTGERTSFTPAV